MATRLINQVDRAHKNTNVPKYPRSISRLTNREGVYVCREARYTRVYTVESRKK